MKGYYRAALVVSVLSAHAEVRTPAEVLRDVRIAVGYSSFANRQSMLARGMKSRRLAGGEQVVYSAVQIGLREPAACVVDEAIFAGSGVTHRRIGFEGDAGIYRSEFFVDGTRVANSDQEQGRMSKRLGAYGAEAVVFQAKEYCARIVLGAFAASLTTSSMDWPSLTRATSGPDVVDVSVDGREFGRIYIDSVSHIPKAIGWYAPGAIDRGLFSSQFRPDEFGLHDVMWAEHRLLLENRVRIDGALVPMRIVHTVDGRIVEETNFDKVEFDNKKTVDSMFDLS